MKKTRFIKCFALVAGFFLVSLFALVLVSSRIIDSETVKSKVREFVAEKTNGLARIEKIDLVWFPRPGFVIRDAAISFGTDIQVSVQRLRLYPSIRHLLTGSWAISSVTADGAAWVVRLPARNDESFNLDEVEEKIRAAVQGLASGLPGMNLRIHGGSRRHWNRRRTVSNDDGHRCAPRCNAGQIGFHHRRKLQPRGQNPFRG